MNPEEEEEKSPEEEEEMNPEEEEENTDSEPDTDEENDDPDPENGPEPTPNPPMPPPLPFGFEWIAILAGLSALGIPLFIFRLDINNAPSTEQESDLEKDVVPRLVRGPELKVDIFPLIPLPGNRQTIYGWMQNVLNAKAGNEDTQNWSIRIFEAYKSVTKDLNEAWKWALLFRQYRNNLD